MQCFSNPQRGSDLLREYQCNNAAHWQTGAEWRRLSRRQIVNCKCCSVRPSVSDRGAKPGFHGGVPFPLLMDELVEIGSRATSREVVSIGMMRRACTTDFKIVPIRRKVRELLGLTRKRWPDYAVAEQWIGISTDEASRMKPSFEDWQMNRWPLIEQRMSRRDCLV